MAGHPKWPGSSAFDDQAAAKPWFKSDHLFRSTASHRNAVWVDAQTVYVPTAG